METPLEFREDAPEALAIERERRLQACRARARAKHPWSGEDVRELRWVYALAKAGHMGAARLSIRVLESEKRLGELAELAPDLLEVLAERHERAALFLAGKELRKNAPDPGALQRWLRVCGVRGTALADAVAEIATIRALSAPDTQVINLAARSLVYADFEISERDQPQYQQQYVADTLWRCAEKGGEGVHRLVARAAELGSPQARLELTFDGVPRHSFTESSEAPWNELAAAIAELRAIEPLGEDDRSYFRKQATTLVARIGNVTDPYFVRGVFLYKIALSRLRSGVRETGLRLRLRAAELGCADAIAAYLDHGTERVCTRLAAGGEQGRAASQALREFCAQSGGIEPAYLAPRQEAVLVLIRALIRVSAPLAVIGKALCFRTGAAIELGELGVAPDRETATGWYEIAASTRARNAKTGMLASAFCWEVGRAFDPASGVAAREEPRLALTWYERGVGVGGPLCLLRLLEAHANAELGLPRDADAALQRLDEYFSEPGHRLDFRETGQTVKALRRCADELDPANAASWRAMAERLSPKETPEQTNPPSELDIKLDLAQAYREMGDDQGADELLAEVLRGGTDAQRARALAMRREPRG